MEGRPWCFDNQLLVLNEVIGHKQPSEITLTHWPFWIRIKDLPFNCRSASICSAIADNLGTVLEVEHDTMSIISYQRVRVNIHITKPLGRFQNIKTKEERVVQVNFAYEQLHFLLWCYWT